MTTKMVTKQDMELFEARMDLKFQKMLEIEREINKTLFAIKLVEKAVFSMIGLVLASFVVGLVGLVWIFKK